MWFTIVDPVFFYLILRYEWTKGTLVPQENTIPKGSSLLTHTKLTLPHTKVTLAHTIFIFRSSWLKKIVCVAVSYLCAVVLFLSAVVSVSCAVKCQ